MALGADYYTEIFTATMEKFDPKRLLDQVLTRHPTLDLFREHANSDTGRNVVVPLEAAEDDSTVLTDSSGTFSTAVSDDIIGAAEYEWSSPLISKARVRWLELQKNSGSSKVVDLMQAHVKAAQKGHAKKIATLLHNRASDRAASEASELESGQFFSLDQLVGTAAYDADAFAETGGAGATAFEVGKIDASVNTYWEANRIEIAADSGTDIRKAFRTVANDVWVNNAMGGITVIVCGRDVYEEYEDSFDDKIRYTSFGEGQTRFRELRFEDQIVRLDPDCPDKRAYFLDLDSIVFRYLAGNFMKVQPSQKITGTLDFVVPMASVISVGVNERRRNAVLLRPDTAGGPA